MCFSCTPDGNADVPEIIASISGNKKLPKLFNQTMRSVKKCQQTRMIVRADCEVAKYYAASTYTG